MTRKSSSVLTTQAPVLQLQGEIAQARLRLEQMENDLKVLIEDHKEQIRRSLKSRIPEEKKMAESIATWWEVPLTTKR